MEQNATTNAVISSSGDIVATVAYSSGTQGAQFRVSANATLREKLEVLGIDSVSKTEVQHFRDGWNQAERVDIGGSKVEYALKYAFGLGTRKNPINLPTEPGSVVQVSMESGMNKFLTLDRKGYWRGDGSVPLTSKELTPLVVSVIVIA